MFVLGTGIYYAKLTLQQANSYFAFEGYFYFIQGNQCLDLIFWAKVA
jgi:hypothetical protein